MIRNSSRKYNPIFFFSLMLLLLNATAFSAFESFNIIECYDSEEAERLRNRLSLGETIQIEEDNNQWKYQCVDLVKHLRKDLTDKEFGVPASMFWQKAQYYGLTRGNNPLKGAVLVWKKGKVGTRLEFGHVAVVTKKVLGEKFEVIEQNWKINDKKEGIVSFRPLSFDPTTMFGFVYDNSEKIECEYVPHGINSVATALVIDRSGSMKGEKLEKALQAAKAYVTTMSSDDQASLSVFSERASTELTMANRDQLIGSSLDSALSSVSAHSATNIGAGLEQGFSQLENASADPDSKVALLMSDGKNNRGSWRSVAEKFKTKHWPVYTVGFGKDADEAALTEIAKITGGTYWPAETQNVANVYQVISAHAKRKCILLSVNEPLAPNGELAYQIPVSQGAEHLNVFTNWQGSRLETCLVLPNGQTLTGKQLRRNGGRFVEGQVFQMLEVNNPQPGEWGLEVSWAEPPPVPEQVNIAVSEKTDVFANMLGFRAEYALGEQVIINVQAAELIGTWNKVPLKNVSVNVRIRKPGPEMIRMVQAQSQNWTMYKDVMLDTTRNVKLFDDGAHNDYNAGDSIWGNTFTETDKNGAYLVTTTITGEKQNGQRIERILQGSFQVGPILQNAVTTSQTLQYIDRAQSHIDSNTPYKEKTFSRPVETIERLQGDPLDSINRLLKGTK
ncbi:MAG: VWA domain-containing protein [Deltaproteobacteria bacterium]|nr:VWA domain-containing protein [Deltaproteobacteria bacterium]